MVGYQNLYRSLYDNNKASVLGSVLGLNCLACYFYVDINFPEAQSFYKDPKIFSILFASVFMDRGLNFLHKHFIYATQRFLILETEHLLKCA